jgi:Fe-Mn family superoxide dismutase
MKRFNLLLSSVLLITILVSCNNKKLTEVVEVPLPTAQEKVTIGFPDDVKADQGSFQLEKLPYAYDALAPTVSPLTLQMHYSKHYLTYTNNLNTALAGTEFENQSIEDILSNLDLNNSDIRNNAGGYYNHSLYWRSMAPNAGGAPTDTLASAIKRDFGSYENFVTTFKSEATKQFASAWVFNRR